MTQQKNAKPFAFKLAQKKQDAKAQKWQAKDSTAVAAGCSGDILTYTSSKLNSDDGLVC